MSQLLANLLRDLLPDWQGGGGGGAWSIQHVQDAPAANETEILHQLAVRRHRLRPHARTARFQVLEPNLRHEPLQRFAKQPFAERASQFLPTHALVPPQEPPQARVRRRVKKIAQVDVALAIALARK